MSVGVEIVLPGATLEWYDEGVSIAGFLPGGPIAPGALSHWVEKTEGGIRNVEVWESREAFDMNAEPTTARLIDETDIPGPPVVRFFEVHNLLPGRPVAS